LEVQTCALLTTGKEKLSLLQKPKSSDNIMVYLVFYRGSNTKPQNLDKHSSSCFNEPEQILKNQKQLPKGVKRNGKSY